MFLTSRTWYVAPTVEPPRSRYPEAFETPPPNQYNQKRILYCRWIKRELSNRCPLKIERLSKSVRARFIKKRHAWPTALDLGHEKPDSADDFTICQRGQCWVTRFLAIDQRFAICFPGVPARTAMPPRCQHVQSRLRNPTYRPKRYVGGGWNPSRHDGALQTEKVKSLGEFLKDKTYTQSRPPV